MTLEDMLVSLDRQHSCHVLWDEDMAAVDFLEVTKEKAQTEHHRSADLKHIQQHTVDATTMTMTMTTTTTTTTIIIIIINNNTVNFCSMR